MLFKVKLFVFISFALMLQSCAVYQKTAVSLDEAAASNKKVLITKLIEKLKQKVEQINGTYYGY
jgi:hypothetical protein